MPQYFTDFSEYTSGAQPNGWTARWNTTGISHLIATDATSEGGKALDIDEGSSFVRTGLSWDSIEYDGNADQEIYFKYDTKGAQIPLPVLRASGASEAARGGYIALLRVNNDVIDVRRTVSGTETSLGTTAFTFNANTIYHCRFRVEGTAVKIRVWADGDAEPATWTAEYADSNITGAGYGIQLGSTGSNNTIWRVHQLGVGTGGDSAPTEQLDAFDITRFGSSTKQLDVSAKVTLPSGVRFKPDGTKMYVGDDTDEIIYQYSLSTAFNISSATYETEYSVDTQLISLQNFCLSDDGTKLFALDSGTTASTSDQRVYQYTLSTPWDISTATYDSKSFIMAEGPTNRLPYGLAFNPVGDRMFISEAWSDDVYQYTLSTPWDISTATYDNFSLDITPQGSGASGLDFNSNGTKLLVTDTGAGDILQYNLPIAWSLSGATYESEINVSTDSGNNPRGVEIKDRDTIFVVNSTNDNVYEYAVVTPASGTCADGNTHYTEVTIPASAIDSNLTDFPAVLDLSRLDGTFWSNVASDGSDIIVYQSDGTTRVPAGVRGFDNVGQTGLLYFKASPLATVDTTYVIRYGSGNAGPAHTDTYGLGNVFDANYLGVYDFEDDLTASTTVLDLTANQHNGTAVSITNANKTTSGPNTLIDLDGVNDWVTLPAGAVPITSGNSDEWDIYQLLQTDAISGASYKGLYHFGHYEGVSISEADNTILIQTNGDNSGVSVAAAQITDNTLYGIHTMFSEVSDYYRIYFNGSQVHSKATTDGAEPETTPLGVIGARITNTSNNIGESWNGLIGHFRVSNVNRSDAWKSAEHASVVNNSTFITPAASQACAGTGAASIGSLQTFHRL